MKERELSGFLLPQGSVLFELELFIFFIFFKTRLWIGALTWLPLLGFFFQLRTLLLAKY